MRILALAALLAAPLTAQITPININGSIWDGNGGPLVAGSVYHITSTGGGCGISVPTGQTLTIHAGAIIKIGGCFGITGNVQAIGTVGQQIAFTSIHDDTAGGDTNGNGGATSPAPGDWGYIDCGGSGSTFEWCNFRFGGSASHAAFELRLQPHTFLDCKLEDMMEDGFQGATSLHAERCQFNNLGGIPVADLFMRNLNQFVDNTAINCAGGEYAQVVSTTGFLGDLLVDHRYSINSSGVFVFNSTTSAVRVPANTHLTLPAGTVFKFVRGRLTSFGSVITQGTPSQPVVFTSIEDDAYGGDTQKDGSATQPAPGDWYDIELLGTDTSSFDHTRVRYAGISGTWAVKCHGSSVMLSNTVIEHSGGDGIFCQNLGAPPMEVTDCTIQNNAKLPIRNLHWTELEKCHNNTTANNGEGDHYFMLVENPTSAIAISPDNFPGDVLVVGNRTTISSGGSLTIPAGTILKFTAANSSGFSTSSATAHLYLQGTARRPVVLTSIKDDTWGGDTNGDGSATAPAPGNIQRIVFGNSAGSSLVENVLVRYGSGNSVECSSPNVSLRSVRVDYANGAGFRLHKALGSVVNAVAYGCVGNGIELQNGVYDLLHASAANNGSDGIKRTSLWSGDAINCNAWNNSGSNIDIPAAQVASSNGVGPLLAGSNGNLDVDPQFVDVANGDLHLSATSPCLDVAAVPAALAVVKDHDETSRLHDHGLTGSMLPDMGAFERAAYRMDVAGVPAIGTSMTFTVQGPAGVGLSFISVNPSPGVLLSPLGFALIGFPNAALSGALLIGQPANFAIPNNPALDGVPFDVQGLGLQFGAGLRGNFTNVDRNRVQIN